MYVCMHVCVYIYIYICFRGLGLSEGRDRCTCRPARGSRSSRARTCPAARQAWGTWWQEKEGRSKGRTTLPTPSYSWVALLV